MVTGTMNRRSIRSVRSSSISRSCVRHRPAMPRWAPRAALPVVGVAAVGVRSYDGTVSGHGDEPRRVLGLVWVARGVYLRRPANPPGSAPTRPALRSHSGRRRVVAGIPPLAGMGAGSRVARRLAHRRLGMALESPLAGLGARRGDRRRRPVHARRVGLTRRRRKQTAATTPAPPATSTPSTARARRPPRRREEAPSRPRRSPPPRASEAAQTPSPLCWGCARRQSRRTGRRRPEPGVDARRGV